VLPPQIPLFPLPNAVLFPNVFLPLHVFEPRYRAMVEDALAGDRVIGMALLKPGWKDDYEGRPPVFPVGCAGVMTHAERLPEGRFNIVLRGLGKFRIASESHERPYRLATVQAIHEALVEADRPRLRDERRRIEALLLSLTGGPDVQLPAAMPDEDVVNALAQYLSLEPLERQALLERDGPVARGRSLAELLEMKLLGSTATGPAH